MARKKQSMNGRDPKPTPMDEARRIRKLREEGMSYEAIGRLLGCSGQKARKTDRLNDLTKRTQGMVEKGTLPKMAAQAVADAPQEAREWVEPQIREGMKESKVKELVNEYVRSNPGTTARRNETGRGRGRGPEVVVWRPKIEVSAAIDEAVAAYTSVKASKDKEAIAFRKGVLTALFFVARKLDKLTRNGSGLAEVIRRHTPRAEADASSEKGGKGKKVGKDRRSRRKRKE